MLADYTHHGLKVIKTKTALYAVGLAVEIEQIAQRKGISRDDCGPLIANYDHEEHTLLTLEKSEANTILSTLEEITAYATELHPGFWFVYRIKESTLDSVQLDRSRPPVSPQNIYTAMEMLRQHGQWRFIQKGPGGFSSFEEYSRVIQEEVEELEIAQDIKGKDGRTWELLDIAWACVFAIASLHINNEQETKV